MDEKKTGQEVKDKETQNKPAIDTDAMEQGFHQLETIYRSRSVQSPKATNVTVREIKKEE